MELPMVDPRLSAQQALQDDPVQRKLQIDALKERLASPNKDEAANRKLKEACQGFESIFLQRIWEQMRKNIGKEGYLHSRDEESYQGMFDQELAKKMAEAGGIGLADMLQEQLSVKLGNASIAVSPGILKGKQQLLPLENLAMPLPTVPGFNDRPKPKAEELYSPLDKDAAEQQAEKQPDAKDRQPAEKDKIASEAKPGAPSALSAVNAPVAGLIAQPGMGMQSQFMLGASLAARLAPTGNTAAAPTAQGAPVQGLPGQPVAQGQNPLAPGLNQMPGQASEFAQTQNNNAPEENLARTGSLPPLPQLDNTPGASTSAPLAAGQLPGAAGQTAENDTPRRTRRPQGFGGITMAAAENSVKKSHLNPFAQNWPMTGPGGGSRNRFAARSGQAAQAQPPEVGRAAMEEPSILRPPAQSMSGTQIPRSEAEINDLPEQNAQGSGIRQVSQSEVEAALRRMN